MKILLSHLLITNIVVNKFLVFFYPNDEVEFKLGFCLSNFHPAHTNNIFVLALSCPFLLPQEVDDLFLLGLHRKSFLFICTSVLPCLCILWHRGINCSCAFKTFFLKSDQSSWTSLPFSTEFPGSLPVNVLNNSKSTLNCLKSILSYMNI